MALDGHDVIGQAKTGTGKTLGFGIPLLSQLDAITDPEHHRRGAPQALVVVPTRELCVQVAEDLAQAGKRAHVKVLAIYGGRAFEPQIESLDKGVDVIVGTPGRLLDLSRRGHLKLSEVRILVLDEADEMLDMGFLPDVEAIVAQVPESRQTMLFSATMPGQIVSLARRYMTPANAHSRGRPQRGQRHRRHHRAARLARARDGQGGAAGTHPAGRGPRPDHRLHPHQAHLPEGRRRAQRARLRGRRGARRPGPGAREQALRAFRKGKVDVLVATDVAARGIDIDDVTHVVNYPARGREGLPAPGGTHGAGRQERRGRHAGRLGRCRTLADDQPRAGPAVPAPCRDLLHVRASCTPAWASPHGSRRPPRTSKSARGCRPRRSRTLARPAKHGGHSNSQRDDRRGDSRRRSGGGSRNGRSGGGQAKSRDTSKDGDKPAARKPRKRRRTRGGQQTKPSGDS